MKRRLLASLVPVVLLASCGDKTEDEAAGDAMDPASEQALNDELMTDPDLAGRNEANAALSGTGNAAIPNIDKSPRAIEAARSRAAELVGGRSALIAVPAARALAEDAKPSQAMVAAARAAVAPGGENCGEKVEYTSAWAAKLPARQASSVSQCDSPKARRRARTRKAPEIRFGRNRAKAGPPLVAR